MALLYYFEKYSFFNFSKTSFTVLIFSVKYALVPANANPFLMFPLDALYKALMMQYALFE